LLVNLVPQVEKISISLVFFSNFATILKIICLF
jgi:hypothetical protein